MAGILKLRNASVWDLKVGDILVNTGGNKWQVVGLHCSDRGPKPITVVLDLQTSQLDSWDPNVKPYDVNFMVEELDGIST